MSIVEAISCAEADYFNANSDKISVYLDNNNYSMNGSLEESKLEVLEVLITGLATKKKTVTLLSKTILLVFS